MLRDEEEVQGHDRELVLSANVSRCIALQARTSLRATDRTPRPAARRIDR